VPSVTGPGGGEPKASRYAASTIPTDHGPIEVIVYRVGADEHVALVRRDGADPSAPWLARVHSECWTGEVLGSRKCDCRAQLDEALRMIEECKHGVVVYLRQEGRGIGLGNKIRAYALQEEGLDTVEANRALGFQDDARSYGVAADILRDLGVGRVRLLTNNPAKVEGLERGGIEVVERIPLVVPQSDESAAYLAVKARRLGHEVP
jgi:3,4-dihydroxy 2-butanone 4-phosphate synthase/GTP cyclohydrolase II